MVNRHGILCGLESDRMISMKYYNTLPKTEEDVRQINRLVDVKNKSVLEIGCGTGRITFPLAERAGEIIAID